MANTFELIASSTVGAGGAAAFDFTSIPSTYTDLICLVSARTSAGGFDSAYLTFNNSSSGYSGKYLAGVGSGTPSSGANSTTYIFVPYGLSGGANTANTFGNALIYVPNYAGSNYKSVSLEAVSETNATSAGMGFDAGLWSNTAAITSLKVAAPANDFVQYSTAYLYGVKNA